MMRKSLSSFLLACAFALPGAVFVPAVADDSSVSAEERALEQTLSEHEPIAEGRVEISSGHVDMGPKYVDGTWTLMFHDDHAETPVWRRAEDVVLKGDDTSLLPKPDDERYSFVKADAGDDVYVIPQTELAGVVWPGWNTQDPEVVSRLGQGVTLTLEKVEGPGQFTLYLENGNFSAPQVLWSSDRPEPQDIWVEPNTHTHANWVFTEPGAYFLTVRAHAELADGTVESDTQRLQFAVGSQTTAEQVFEAAAARGEVGASASADESATAESGENSADEPAAQDSFSAALPWVLGGLLLLLVLAGSVFMVGRRRGASAQEQARELLK